MTKKEKQEEGKKEYTGGDLIEETMKILEHDNIAKKLPKDQLLKLSQLLAKTALKGDL